MGCTWSNCLETFTFYFTSQFPHSPYCFNVQASTAGYCVGSTTSYADLNIWYLLRDNFDAQYTVRSQRECIVASFCCSLSIDKLNHTATSSEFLLLILVLKSEDGILEDDIDIIRPHYTFC
jgi:hypothetical protein